MLVTGTVYVARSLSDDPAIKEVRNILHKVGVTSQDVRRRIADAKNDPTFLMAPVEIVATYELQNMERSKVENVLHRFFDEARPSELAIADRFGKKVHPREWFYVLPEHVSHAVDLIRQRTLHQYRYVASTQAIVRLEEWPEDAVAEEAMSESQRRRFIVEAEGLPDLPQMMLAVLEALRAVGGSATLHELDEKVVELEGVTEEEQAFTMPKDSRPRLNYYLAWARTFLRRGGAIENSSRGVWSLTEQGGAMTSLQQMQAIHEKVNAEEREKARQKRLAAKASAREEEAHDLENQRAVRVGGRGTGLESQLADHTWGDECRWL